jgi:hypothetical protein
VTVAVNATASAATTGNGVAALTNANLTVPAGSTALLAFLTTSTFGTPVSAVSLRWDSAGTNQAMTQVASSTLGGNSSFLFGLLSPTSGLKTLSASWTGSGAATLYVMSFSGTATDTIANAFKNANSATGATTAVALTGSSAVGNVNVIGVGDESGNSVNSLSATGSTSLFNITTNNGGAGAYAPGAASVAWTATLAVTDNWSACCIDVSAPASTLTPILPAQSPIPAARSRALSLLLPGQVAPVSTAKETTTVDRWWQPLSLPVLRAGLAAAVMASGAVLAPPQVAVAPVPSVASYVQPLSQPVLRTGLSAAQQPAFAAAVNTAKETTTVDRWYTPFSDPVRRPWTPSNIPSAVKNTSTPIVAAIVNLGWAAPLSQPTLRVQEGGDFLALAVSQDVEATTVDRWFQPFSMPLRKAWSPASLPVAAWTGFVQAQAPTVKLEWWRPWPDPIRRQWSPSSQPAFATSGSLSVEPTTVDRWWQPLSVPVPRVGISTVQQPAYSAPASAAPETTTVDRWLTPLGVPVPRGGASAAALLSGITQPPPQVAPPVATSEDRWHQPLAQPVLRTGLGVAIQSWTATGPVSTATETTTVDRWFEPLSVPVLRGGVSPAQQPSYSAPASESPETTTVDRWITPFGIPVPRGGPSLAALSAGATLPPPQIAPPAATSEDRWHQLFSQPVLRVGLGTGLQSWGATAPVSVALEATTVDRWHQPLSQPVLRVGLAVAQQPATVTSISQTAAPTTVDRWHEPLSVPVRRIPQAALGVSVAPVSLLNETTSADRWWQPLSVPVLRLPSGPALAPGAILNAISVQLNGTGAFTDSGSGGLTTSIVVLGTGSSTDSASGVLSTSIRLQGTGTSADNGAADLTTGNPIVASGSSADTAIGALTPGVVVLSALGASTDGGSAALSTAIILTGGGGSADSGIGPLRTPGRGDLDHGLSASSDSAVGSLGSFNRLAPKRRTARVGGPRNASV